MRLVPVALLALLTVAILPARAASLDDQTFNQQTIDALQVRIAQAQPREQCFLYAELVHQLTEYSLRQYADGNVEKSAALLHQVAELSGRIHMAVALDTKRLKSAEILLRHTAFRLKEMLHATSVEDHEMVTAALTHVNRVQNEAMMTVFATH